MKSETDTTQNHDGRAFRYGVIGTGAMGRSHIEVVANIDGAEVVALADPFADSRTAAVAMFETDVPAYADHRELLDKEELDAVIIATPNWTHADIVCDALEAGLHVLGEKPMSATIAECNRVLQASRRTEKLYQAGMELPHTELAQRVQSLIDDETLGAVRQVWCKEFRGPWALKVDQWITQKEKSGGALVEKNCHHFDLFNRIIGRTPVRVTGFGTCDLVYGPERFEGVTPDVLDNAQVLVSYENGATAALMLCMYCSGYEAEGLEVGVIGTEGWLTANWGLEQDTLRVGAREKGTVSTATFELPTDIRLLSHSGSVYAEHVAFLNSLRTGQRPVTDADAAWWCTAVALAAECAVAEQRIVSLSEFGPPGSG